MSQVALYLTWGFVLILLVRDHRNSRTLPGLWVPVLWILILGSRSPAYWFTSGSVEITPEAYIEGNPVSRGVYLGLIILGVLVLFRRRVDWSDLARRNRALFAFLGFCALSVLWAEYPLVALKGNIKAGLGNIVMALIVLTDPSPVDAIKALIRRCTFVLIPLSVFFIKFVPAIGRTYHRYTYETLYRGVATGANGLATTCFICGLLIISVLLRKDSSDKKELGINLLMLSMIVWLLNKADGATSLVCLIIGTGFLILHRWNLFRQAIVLMGRNFGSVFVVVTLILVFNYSWFINITADFIGHSETLWGRFELWNVLVAMSGNPLWGLGYGNFWVGARLEALWALYSWHPTEAHNGYLETYLNLGFFGVALLAAMIVSAIKKTANSALKPQLRFLKLPYLLPLVLYNLTESAFRGLHLGWFIFLLFAIETRGQMHDQSLENSASITPSGTSSGGAGRRVS